MHAIAHLQRAAKSRGAPLLEKLCMFHAVAGTTRLHSLLERGVSGAGIIASWQSEVQRFKALRAQYLMY